MTVGDSRPVVAVIHGAGSVGPAGVLAAAADWCVPAFVADSGDPEGRRVLEAVADLYPCLDLAGCARAPSAGAAPNGGASDGTESDGAAVAEYLAGIGVAGITTFSDERLLLTASAAELLGLPFHTRRSADRLRRKDLQREVLNANRVSVTRSAPLPGPADIDAAVAAVGLPAVIKPVAGTGSALVRRVDTVPDIVAHLRRTGPIPLCLEELLVGVTHPAGDWLGDYVSVEVLTVGPGRHTVLCVTDRLPLLAPMRETGLLIPSALPPDWIEAVTAEAIAALDALDVHIGLSHVELKLTARGPRVLEVNGRLGGFVPELLLRTGRADAVRLALTTALDKAPERALEPTLDGTPPADPVRADATALAYLVHAPVWARTVRQVADQRLLRGLPGVWRVEQHVGPGARVDVGLGTQGRVQTIWLAGEDHASIRNALTGVDAVLATGNRFE
jgi:biotin carboxylase